KVTGYPFNYADLNSPVPYSAWNGQAMCEYPGDYRCNVIYENQYNPQLAMPPGIRKLDPAWEGCQMWYGGLYDPPYALKPGTAVETPTVAFGPAPTTTTSAVEASSAAPTTPTPTALADHTTDRAGSTQGQENNDDAGQTQAANTAGRNQDTQNTQTQNGAQNTQAAQSTQGGNQNDNGGNSQSEHNDNDNSQNSEGVQSTQGGQNTRGGQNTQEGQKNQGGQTQGGAQNTRGGQSQNGAQGNQGGQGQYWNPTQTAGQGAQGGQSNQNANTANGAQNTQGPQAQDGSSQSSSPSSAKPHVYVFTAGTFTYTATQTNSVYVCGTNTLSVGGPAATLSADCVISAGSSGLVINTGAATITNRPSAVTALPVITKAVIITVGTKVQTFSEKSSGVVEIGSTRLTPGGPAATLDDGSVVSADSEGVKVGSSIFRYSTVAPASAAAAPNVVVFVVGTKTVTASCPPGSTNEAVIGSHTLTAGGPVQTLEDGSRISLASGGAIVVDGTSAAAIATPASAIVFTVNGNAVTAYQAADVSSVATIDGTVISQNGPAVTLPSGEVVSMGSNGLVVQQGSTTVPVSAFSTIFGEDGSSPSSSASGSRSGSGAKSNNAAMSSTRSAQQDQEKGGVGGGGGVGLANTTIDEEVKRQRPRRGTAVLDAHWAALQSTLSDIELSAGSSAHVFGTGHAKALEELRAAQVELARAWGQTDSEDTSTLPSKEAKSPDAATAQRNNSKDTGNKETTQDRHQSNKEQEKQAEQNERKLSTATTLDLTSAARRREASDKYFAAVKEGVAEVVRKLDGVADAMREVEMQSRDIWGDDGKDSSEMTESEFGSLSS
ncbi:hypothetical protein KCU98_g4510, partial [Aureobasidium melanogenum]